MNRWREGIWSLVGLGAVLFAGYFLYRDFKGHSAGEILDALREIRPGRWALATLSTALAYGALAWYDQIALTHIGRKLSWRFVSLVSFIAYAIGHNVGASVVTSGFVRYRAYSRKGLSAAEIGYVSAFASLTFVLGALLTGGLVLLADPQLIDRWEVAGPWLRRGLVLALLFLPWLYGLGALLKLKPFHVFGFTLAYPLPPIAARQLIVGPIELIGAAGIIYFALPVAANPGFLTVLGVFVASFSAALVSHAPGGLGVLELTFLKAMPDEPKSQVLAALLAFRLLYLLIPFAISLAFAAAFERRALAGLWRRRPQ